MPSSVFAFVHLLQTFGQNLLDSSRAFHKWTCWRLKTPGNRCLHHFQSQSSNVQEGRNLTFKGKFVWNCTNSAPSAELSNVNFSFDSKHPAVLLRAARPYDLAQIQQLLFHKNLEQPDTQTVEKYIQRHGLFVAAECLLDGSDAVVGMLRLQSVPCGSDSGNLLREFGILPESEDSKAGRKNTADVIESQEIFGSNEIAEDFLDEGRIHEDLKSMLFYYGGSLIIRSDDKTIGMRLVAFACSQSPALVKGALEGNIRKEHEHKNKSEGIVVGLLFGCFRKDYLLIRDITNVWVRHPWKLYGKGGKVEQLHGTCKRHYEMKSLGSFVIYRLKKEESSGSALFGKKGHSRK